MPKEGVAEFPGVELIYRHTYQTGVVDGQYEIEVGGWNYHEAVAPMNEDSRNEFIGVLDELIDSLQKTKDAFLEDHEARFGFDEPDHNGHSTGGSSD